jgi:transcription initiation factor TFIIB
MQDIELDLVFSLAQSFKTTRSHDINLCAYCTSDSVSLIDGNYICSECNSVLDRFIDNHAEWRYYGANDNRTSDPSRCGLPTSELFTDSALGSVISSQANESYDMKIVKRYHMWSSMTYKDRSLYNIFDQITLSAINHGISPSIIEEAKAFYKKVADQQISRGENRSGLIATSIYMSCKSNKVPRSTKEIAKIFNLKPSTMTKGCKKFQDILKLNIGSCNPLDFINRFCSKLSLASDIVQICKTVAEKADELNLVCESTPPSIAAAVIYLVVVCCNIKTITKKDLSDACELSQVTLTKCYKKLFDHKEMLMPFKTQHPV